MKIVGSIVRNARFGSLFCEIWRKPRTNVRFGGLFFEISRKPRSKTIVSCDASSKFHRTSFQTSVSHDASDNFHRNSFQNDRFVRCFLEISQNKLPKRSFRARLPRNFTEEARKINVSCEASSKFHRRSFQNDRFVRGFSQFSQNKLPKRTFCAMPPTIFTEKASKTIVSCDASSKFHRTSFQNERFAQGFRQFSQKKLPKRSFRAMRPRNFTEQASKTSVSHEASDNFHRKSFQNDRFVRCFFEISQNKLPKRSFRARLPRNFTEEARKINVSCEASSKFHRRSFQNDRFVRGFFQISQNKLPKGAFRAMLPTIFTEKASKIIVSCEASSKFNRRSFQNDRFVRGFFQISQNNASKTNVSRDASDNFQRKFAFRRSFVQWTRRILREGSSSKSKMCVSLQRRAIQNFKTYVLLQRGAQKRMNPAHDVRGNPRHTKITISPQFRTSDQHNPLVTSCSSDVQN